MITSRQRFALIVLAFALEARTGHAQSGTGFAVGRYEPADRGAGWFVVDALDLRGRRRPSLGVTLDYAYKPLVVYDAAGDERLSLVRHQLVAHVGGAIVLADRVRLGLNVPFAIHHDGEDAVVRGVTLSGASAPAIGDVRLGADLQLAGRHRGPLAIAIGIRAWAPTGLRSQFTSDGTFRAAPQILVSGEVGVFAWAARASWLYRPREDTYAGTSLGSEAAVAVGAGVRTGRFLVGPEVFVATRLDQLLGERSTPADAVLGIHYEHPSGLRWRAGIGSGLTRGYGSPAFRALLSVEWGAPIPSPPTTRVGPEPDDVPRWEPAPEQETKRPLAVVTASEIRIAEQIRFATDSAELLDESSSILSAVKQLLDEHPELRKVRIEGHTDDVGDPAYNDELSARRAASVATWLTERGIDRARLETKGHGSRQPLEANTTEEGRAKNRRVVFVIVERDER